MPTDKSPPSTQPVSIQGISISIATMVSLNVLGTPAIHAGNVVAAAAVKNNVGTLKAMQAVYQGLGDNPKNHYGNFFRGTRHHLGKETARALARAPALAFLNPYLQSRFSASSSAVIFAGALSCYEMAINAFDAAKAKAAIGQPFHLFSKDAFAGSFGNGCRIFISWYGFFKATNALNPLLKNHGIDPNSLSGMLMKTPFQTIAWTALSYPLETVLRRMQVSPEHYQSKSAIEVTKSWVQFARQKESLPKSVYLTAAKEVAVKQGMRGLFFGVSAKLVTNAGLSLINNALPVATQKGQALISELASPRPR